MKKFIFAVAELMKMLAGYRRECYVCQIPITDMPGVTHDHRLCSECHSLTRPLARRRRKEYRKRKHSKLLRHLTPTPIIVP
jgi:hypothetical protein